MWLNCHTSDSSLAAVTFVSRHSTGEFFSLREWIKILVFDLAECYKMSNATQPVELDGHDLPAHCPNPAMPLWSSHPRVFLDFKHGEAKCPYCGTQYKLKPGTEVGHH